MAKKQIDNIPGWFSQDSFKFLDDLDAIGWAILAGGLSHLTTFNLDAAKFFAEILASDKGRPVAIEEAIEEYFAAILSVDELRGRVPVAPFQRDPNSYIFRSVRSFHVAGIASMAALLADLPGGQIALKLAALIEKKGGYADLPKKQYALMMENEKFLSTPFFIAVRESGKRGKRDTKKFPELRAISVDMTVPDSVILSDFKDWLKKSRELDIHSAAPRAFTPTDFSEWASNCYPQLLLLTKWCELVGRQITYAELAIKLFPAERIVTGEDIRKTHLPNAKRWACMDTVNALKVLAEDH